jgi:EmrB/QacA subfamily drug resistance transporter
MGDVTHPWRVLSIMLAGIFMALLDVTIVNVALPAIQNGIHVSGTVLEWVVSGYALAFGLVLIPAGRLGDDIGHKYTFISGLALFTLSSLGCALAQEPWQIITARVFQGFGAGIFAPAIAASIRILFEGRARSHAFSVLGAVIGASTALGPLIGGIMVQYVGWQSVFMVNVPIGLILIPLAIWKLPAYSPETKDHTHDHAGLFLLSAGLITLLFPLIEGQRLGWPAWTWISLVASVILLTTFWHVENKLLESNKEPLLPPHLFRERAFAGGVLLALLYFSSFTSIFFTLSLLWQTGFGHSPLATGLTILPFALCSMIAASQSDKVSARVGRWVLVLGCLFVAIGLTSFLLVIHFAGTSVTHWQVLLPLAFAGVGNGFFIAPNQDFILATVPPHEAGTASGVLSTAQRIGSSIGIAFIGSILFGTLHVKNKADLAAAFSHSAQLATLVNVGLIIVALILVFILPKQVPDQT